MKNIDNASLNKEYVNKEVTVYGWANKIRKLGNLIFIDLRDRSGIVQLCADSNTEAYKICENIKNEYVLKATGKVILRSNPNKDIPSGEIEIELENIEILNESAPLPFDLNNNTANEDTRLKYRYLDLRSSKLQNYLKTKHMITKTVRNYLDDLGFMDVDTPILTATSPEGARDYLVPSRVQNGKFYALPQSPQLFKQLLMVAGFEKYYQIAKCFRDEDLRSDRQPEFTQIDMEMSFADEEDIFKIVEGMFTKIMKDVKGIDIKTPFPRMKYDDAINLYGSDKPDTRFEMLLHDITDILTNNEMQLLNGKNIGAIVAHSDKYSRKIVEGYEEKLKNYKINNLFFIKYNDEISGNISKAINEEEMNKLIKELDLVKGDTVFIVADKKKNVKQALGALRLMLGKDLGLIDQDKFNYLWIVDFPMFEWSEEEGRYISAHHPFTMPKDPNKLDDKENCYARSFDIVLNGYELASGSVRIHDRKVQNKVFECLGISEEEALERFGYLLEAFKYGAPPHVGIAPGLDRLTMLLCGTDNIKDVVAFPKTQKGSCLMTNAPSKVSEKQLKELGIKF